MKRHARITLLFFFGLWIGGPEGRGQTTESGFIPLLNGSSLEGWEGDPTYWRIENGTLVGEVTPTTLLKTNTFLIWQQQQPADFELKGTFRITKDGNSGINYRSERVPEVPYALKGYQADIDGKNKYTGQNYEERGRTTLAYRGQQTRIQPFTQGNVRDLIKNNAWTMLTVEKSLGEAEALQSRIKTEDWNEFHLIVKGNRLQHFINGVLMSDVTDLDTVHGKKAGLLGVQVHVGPPMKVEYRNLRLKTL